MEKLKQFQFSKSQVMVSFDVVSLFTNVPLSDTIELIADRIYTEDNPNAASFNRDIFKKLIFLATQGIFMFSDRLYKQIDGVTMGHPLGPTLANFFLGHLEEKTFAQNSSTAPKLYLRYIDDVYAIFDDNNFCTSFLFILNSQHKDIKFTVKKATKTLFLDVEINVTDNGFESWVWRKKTNIGVIFNYNAICPDSWKTGLIMCLLKRAKTICSNNTLYDKEICRP